MARDATKTRERLMDAALRLWADRGVEVTSLNEIHAAADQRNASALQYHFGNRAGLLAAVFERHVPGIRSRREELLGIARLSNDLRSAAEALVLPVAELILGDWREQAFVCVAADLMSTSSRSDLQWLIGESAVVDATDLVVERAGALPPVVSSMRIQVAGNMVIHAAADYIKRGATRGGRRARQPDLFLANLVDMWVAAVAAEISAATRGVLAAQPSAAKP